MKRLVLLGALLAGCDPDVCGSVEISAVNPETMQWDSDGDGDLDLVEFCGTDYGAFGIDRPDYDMMIVSFDANAPENDLDADFTISRVVLPAAQIVFLNKHLVPGTKLGMANIAGNGLHKTSENDIYQVYPLTAASITIISGPHDYEEEMLIETRHWTEEWEIEWDLTFGRDAEHWKGRDRIKRSDGSDVGSPASVPPDYQP